MRFKDTIPDFIKDYIYLSRLRLKYPGRIIRSAAIGKNVDLGLPCAISRGTQIGDNVAIGDYSYVNDGTVIGSGKLGKFCSIGYFCQIGVQEHPTQYLSTSPHTYGAKNIFRMQNFWNDFNAPPMIGNDVWVGSQSLILQGITIADGAIVAGGSVVTKDVSPYEIVAGNPAKPIRKRFNDQQIADLLDLNWWHLPTAQLQELRETFLAKEEWYSKFAVYAHEGN